MTSLTAAANRLPAAPTAFDRIIETADGWLWGRVLIVLILAVGILLTVRTRCVQVRYLGRALTYAVKREPGGSGEVSSFGALCTSLAATIGTGNIVGVATAIGSGGPGALLWMLIAAFFGMATKYAEGLLAVRYREEVSPGHFLGGPFCYIERGLGARRRWLAKLFAVCGAGAGILGIGTITQSNGIVSALGDLLDPGDSASLVLFGLDCSPAAVITSTAVTLAAAAVILGGVRRIAKVSAVVVPFMAGAYVLCSLIILLIHIRALPAAVTIILRSAFEPAAVGGAIEGLLLKNVIRMGVGRGVFSNEAGLGSAPIAAACARTNDPVRQGLVTMTGTFIDTFIVCTLTGLSIVVTGAWDPRVTGTALTGADITAYAWRRGLPFDEGFSATLLTLCLVFFAFTTIIGWNYYGERCLEYLCGRRRGALRLYRILYLAAVGAGPFLTVSAAWGVADLFNGLMAFPNLLALLLLSGTVAKETRARFSRRRPPSGKRRITDR